MAVPSPTVGAGAGVSAGMETFDSSSGTIVGKFSSSSSSSSSSGAPPVPEATPGALSLANRIPSRTQPRVFIQVVHECSIAL
eukprot:9490248-Pyramimonas_sp.AAC.1